MKYMLTNTHYLTEKRKEEEEEENYAHWYSFTSVLPWNTIHSRNALPALSTNHTPRAWQANLSLQKREREMLYSMENHGMLNKYK